MPIPVTTVEIAFNVGVTGTPTWTDVTRYVRTEPGISIEHWRGEEDSETQASRCSLTLMNNDGRFTPENTASPYYPNVKRNRPIRVRSTHNGVTYTRFTGYMDDWPVDWPATVGTISDCAVSASSRSSRLARGAELRSIIEEEFLADSPSAYYTLGEPEGSTTAVDTTGNDAPSLVVRGTGAAVTFGDATGPGTDDLTAVSFAGGQYLETSPLEAGVIGLELFQLRSAIPGNNRIIAAASDGTNWVALVIDNTGGAGLVGNGLQSTTSTAKIADGTYHHLYWDIASADIWIDGVADGGGTGSLAVANPTIVTIGGWRGDADHGSSEPHMDGTNGTAHVALHTAEPSGARKLAHYTAGHDGFAGETSADRIERFAGYANVPTADLDLAGSTPIAHFDITGMTALDAMRKVETTEGGVLYDALDGKLAFRGREARYAAASAFTVSVAAREVAAPPHPVLDDQQQVNDMTATNADGIAGRVFDQASIDEDGLYRESVELATSDPGEPLMRAGWIVGRYAESSVRVSELQLLLNTASNTLAAGVLSAQIGTKFTLTGLPSNAPRSTMTLFVEGRQEQITGAEDRVTLLTSPAELFEVFTLDSATLGVLDSDRLAY